MTDSEKREGARRFYQKWVGRGEEDKDDRSYWTYFKESWVLRMPLTELTFRKAL